MSSAFSPRLPRNRYTPSFSILVKCHRKTSKKKKMCETHLEVTKPTLHLTPMSFFQMRQIFATSMLRCVLGISGYLSFWRKWRHQISTRSWYRSQWPSAGRDGIEALVGWTENLRYLIVPNGVDTSQEGWKHIEGIQKKPPPSIHWFKIQLLLCKDGKINKLVL